MLDIHRILIARDRSSCSDHALNEALFLASETGAELHVLHVDVLLGPPDIEREELPGEVEALNERLQELAAAHRAEGHTLHPEQVQIFDVVERGVSPSSAIVSYAEDHDIDLIVVGTHGRTGLRHLLMGSVAEEVTRTAPCPVLTVHAADNGERTPRRVGSILVPVDFSDASGQALRYAAQWAKLYGARLKAVHVMEELAAPSFYLEEVRSVSNLRPLIEERTIQELERFAREVLGSVEGVSLHAISGNATEGIVSFASTACADLIVLFTQGLIGFGRLLAGSTAERVLRQASCPVLTFRPVPELARGSTAVEFEAAAI